MSRISSREYEEAKIIGGQEGLLDDRRDEGIVRLGIAIMRAMGWKGTIDRTWLLPVPERTQPDLEQQAAMFERYADQHNRKWQRNQSALLAQSSSSTQEAGPLDLRPQEALPSHLPRALLAE
jgi:hypothetical protein